MRMPMIEKIVHTAKQTVKAMVDIQSARALRAGGRKVSRLKSVRAHQLLPCAGVRPKQKSCRPSPALIGAMA